MEWHQITPRHFVLRAVNDPLGRRAEVVMVETRTADGRRIYKWEPRVIKFRWVDDPVVFDRKKDAMDWCIARLVIVRMHGGWK